MPKNRTPSETAPAVALVITDDFDNSDDPFISRAEILAVKAALPRDLDQLFCSRPLASKPPVLKVPASKTSSAGRTRRKPTVSD